MNTLIFLIAHEPLASALRECALHVFADCASDLCALDVQADAPPDQTLERARDLLQDCGKRPVLVLTDLFGATPCNVARRLAEALAHARLVTGVNLPMLLRAVSYRAETLDLLVQRAVVGGTQGVMQVAVGAPEPGMPLP
ncbi:MAG: PTS fructose transporter subunit IIA [Burkholderiaceae bacterium]|jgi:PTS system ascorbate-specific IIA component|nr:PTS fructose transporter subunit IIA [Burkholderiaceae bacterium]